MDAGAGLAAPRAEVSDQRHPTAQTPRSGDPDRRHPTAQTPRGGDPDRWKRISRLFAQSLLASPEERERLLAESGESADVIAEVQSLLAAHDLNEADKGFLEAPPPAEPVPEEPLYAPGSMVGFYRINGVAGRGGMGVVYDAEDTLLRRRVALKSLPPGFAGDTRRRDRLQMEARAAGALQHPGIAIVYTLYEVDGQLFIVSEYLEGDTLRVEMDRGRQPHERVLAAAVEITSALVVAHERGIVHRDLKPENIVRITTGALKILDFGLAQFDEAAHDLASMTRLTQQGLLAGTPGYMPPEQLHTGHTDFRGDHFALGVILYEMCTASHPFGGKSKASMLARILTAEPTPPSPADVPPRLWTVIERCLQKDPANRFATTRELLAALKQVQEVQRCSARCNRLHLSHAPCAPLAPLAPALKWWRIHQLAATLVYSAMVWPAWIIHRSFGAAGLAFFFSILAAVVVAGMLRIHLLWTSFEYPDDLQERRAEVSRMIWWADAAFAALLIIAGIALPADKAGWAALFISVGLGVAISFLVIEPATARAAFRQRTN